MSDCMLGVCHFDTGWPGSDFSRVTSDVGGRQGWVEGMFPSDVKHLTIIITVSSTRGRHRYMVEVNVYQTIPAVVELQSQRKAHLKLCADMGSCSGCI